MEVYDSCGQRFSFSSWDDFLGNWEEYGDEFVRLAVKHPDFTDWMKVVQPARAELVEKVLGNDAYLTGAFLTMADVEADYPAFTQIADLVKQSVADPEEHVPQLLEALNGRSGSLLPAKGLAEEITFWQAKLENEKRKEPKPGDEMTITLPGGVPMTFCWCPATTSEDWKRLSGGDDFFWMGSPVSEEGRDSGEAQHKVMLTEGFWMGKYEVTQRQWISVANKNRFNNPSFFEDDDHPVDSVSWNDCQEFVGKINSAGQVRVSLPTEAQWEYACRAGTTTPFNFGSILNGDKANCDGYYYPYGMSRGRWRKETSPVGEYPPNAWGLYDMHGNVWEYCADWCGDYKGDATDPTGPVSGTCRVIRGGSWNSSAQCCRSASRDGIIPPGNFFINYYFGFRLVCSLPIAAACSSDCVLGRYAGPRR